MDLLQGYRTITEQENKRMIYRDNDQLVNELKKVMIDTNTKQVDIANMMEVPKQAITKIFNKKNLTCDDMQKLLSLMGYELHIDFIPVEQSEKQCTCSTDKIIFLFVCGGQYVSLCDGHICDCIVFGFWYVFPTFGMFLGVILERVTTLWVEMG